MRKFLIKIWVFSLVIGIPFLVLNNVYMNTNYFKSSSEVYELKYYPDDITLLNLGNSHEMQALRYEKFYNGVFNNFATSSQPFYYSYQVLVSAEGSIEDEAVVLIPISYFDWYYDYISLYTSSPTYNNRYYSFLKPTQMLNFDLETYVTTGIFPLLTAKENIRYIFEDWTEWEIEAVNNTVVTNVESLAEYRYDIWCNDVMELGEDKDSVYQDNFKWFINIVEYCKQQNYTPVIIISPVTSVLTSIFGDDFMADFDAKNQVIKDMYPEVLFLDYSRDSEFCDNLGYFKDADHLNSIGGDAYTQRVLSDLVKYNVLKAEDLK